MEQVGLMSKSFEAGPPGVGGYPGYNVSIATWDLVDIT